MYRRVYKKNSDIGVYRRNAKNRQVCKKIKCNGEEMRPGVTQVLWKKKNDFLKAFDKNKYKNYQYHCNHYQRFQKTLRGG